MSDEDAQVRGGGKNFFRIWAKLDAMRAMLAQCEQASRVPDRALMATALSSVIQEAEQLRLYVRPVEWLTLEERADLVRQEMGAEARGNTPVG